MPFTHQKLAILDVIEIEPQVFPDGRGYFLEQHRKSAFAGIGIHDEFTQTNMSYSKKNVIRGLHYQQAPAAQAKLVHVIDGDIFDVAVDIRPDSETYGKWVGLCISSKKHNMIYIPKGFAHGFSVLSDYALVQYFCAGEYDAQAERGIRYDDPTLAIDWKVTEPIISDKDRSLPFLK